MSSEQVGSGSRSRPALTAVACLERVLESLERVGLVPPAEDGTFLPDAAMCDDCTHEIENPRARRFGYAFTSCSRCGPRFSLARTVGLRLCAQCEAEYESPEDRHFRAEPLACPTCGPRLWLEIPDGRPLPMIGNDAGDAAVIAGAQRLLGEGAVLAIKGTGGFHLACDATNAGAVRRLRQRKGQGQSAFALMARSLAVIARYCDVGPAARTALGSPAAPVVVLPRRGGALPDDVAPGLGTLGFMLPATPLHYLLMARLDEPVVMTSGNRATCPSCTDNRAARLQLAEIADAFLMHDRDIVNRVDDSIVHVVDGAARVLRRARGYAPATLRMPPGFEQAPRVLSMGGDLKNTFCLLQEGRAMLSAHQGDLQDAATCEEYRWALDSLSRLFEHTPECLAVDPHPEYLSTKLGKERARLGGVALESVQHRHAHAASCLVDNGVPLDAPPVLAVVLDGPGMGLTRELWSGEFLITGYAKCTRIACLQPGRPGVSTGQIAADSHIGLADAVVRLASTLAAEGGIGTAALSGDVFENATLFERIATGLRDAGMNVLTHRQIPPNDGGLAIGQAAVAAARLLRRRR